MAWTPWTAHSPPFPSGGAEGAARAPGQLVSSAGAWWWAARLWQRRQGRRGRRPAPACSWKWGPRGYGKGAGTTAAANLLWSGVQARACLHWGLRPSISCLLKQDTPAHSPPPA